MFFFIDKTMSWYKSYSHLAISYHLDFC